MMSEASRNAMNAEIEAIKALCHHKVCDLSCDACRFRAQVAAEQIVELCKGLIRELGS